MPIDGTAKTLIGLANDKADLSPCITDVTLLLTHLSLASFLWDIGKQHSPRCDAAECGVPSGVILFAQKNFIQKWDKK